MYRGNAVKRRLQVGWFQLTDVLNPISKDISNRALCHTELEKMVLPILWHLGGHCYKTMFYRNYIYVYIRDY